MTLKPENCGLEGKGSAKFRSEEAFVTQVLKGKGLARGGHPEQMGAASVFSPA